MVDSPRTGGAAPVPPPGGPASRVGGVALVLAVVLDVALAVALVGPRTADRVAFVDPARPAPAWTPVGAVEGRDAAVVGRLTADDVARGVWALAAGPEGPALTDAQRAALVVPFGRALAHRDRVGALRTERRAAVAALAAQAAPVVDTPGIVGAARRPAPPRRGP